MSSNLNSCFIINLDELMEVKLLLEDMLDGEDHIDRLLEIANLVCSRPHTPTRNDSDVLEFLIWADGKQNEMHDIMRRNHLVIDNLNDPMQKWIFTFYSEVAEMSNKASQLLEQLRQQHNDGE